MPEQCDNVISSIFSTPWAILPDRLDVIIAIANRQLANGELAAAVAADRERAAENAAALGREKNIAVIPVFGVIMPRANWITALSGAVGVSHLSAALDAALADRDVEAVVFDFDSPGGEITGIHEFARRIRAANSEKPITAYVSGMAASAAYWLACACGRIVADRTAPVGCIGVVSAWTDEIGRAHV